jgi:hypothetical protein
MRLPRWRDQPVGLFPRSRKRPEVRMFHDLQDTKKYIAIDSGYIDYNPPYDTPSNEALHMYNVITGLISRPLHVKQQGP